MLPTGYELGTLHMLGERDNHSTTVRFIELNEQIVWLAEMCDILFCVNVLGCTFGVIEMDGSKVVEPHFQIKLIKHGLHSPLRCQVVTYKDKKQHFSTNGQKIYSPDGSFIILWLFHINSSVVLKHRSPLKFKLRLFPLS